jgi:hypothetical protein
VRPAPTDLTNATNNSERTTTVRPVDSLLNVVEGVARNGSGWIGRCPAHDDRHASLSISEADDGKMLVHCHAGCSQDAVLEALAGRGLRKQALYPAVRREIAKSLSAGLALEALAEFKQLPPEFLKTDFTLSTIQRNRGSCVRIPYRSVDGHETAVRYRLALEGERRFVWKTGSKTSLYGLDRLATVRAAGWALLVEGESDTWTGWHHNLPVLGLPGKATWRPEWATYLDGLDVVAWQEPEAADFAERIARDIPNLRVIVAPAGRKDISAAHMNGDDVATLVERLRAAAPLATELCAERDDAELEEVRRQAAPTLQSADPLKLVSAELRRLGYGGALWPAEVTYLAATSRLLRIRPGAIPVHVIVLGPPSAGKSYTIAAALRLLPAEAFHVIDAGSPRVLIYDDADLRHRVVVFSEADSLPAGEDNPAASAVRNLLQDGHLHYKVTVRHPETGDYVVRTVTKPGPTVMFTTAVHRLGEQLDSRLFTVEPPDTVEHLRDAIAAQVVLEAQPEVEPDGSLVAFQMLLQRSAPWDVVIPFAKALGDALGRSPNSARVLRDFSRLLALVKSVAILRHVNRKRDAAGRLVAEIDDYRAVFELVADVYDTSATGSGQRVRDTVAAVAALRSESKLEHVTKKAVAEKLDISVASAWRRIRAALRGGWLANSEGRKGYPADLVLGDPLPPRDGLPDPDLLESDFTISPSTVGKAPREAETPSITAPHFELAVSGSDDPAISRLRRVADFNDSAVPNDARRTVA